MHFDSRSRGHCKTSWKMELGKWNMESGTFHPTMKKNEKYFDVKLSKS